MYFRRTLSLTKVSFSTVYLPMHVHLQYLLQESLNHNLFLFLPPYLYFAGDLVALRSRFHACLISVYGKNSYLYTGHSSLPADVLWGSFVTHSFLRDKRTPKDVCGEAKGTEELFVSLIVNCSWILQWIPCIAFVFTLLNQANSHLIIL